MSIRKRIRAPRLELRKRFESGEQWIRSVEDLLDLDIFVFESGNNFYFQGKDKADSYCQIEGCVDTDYGQLEIDYKRTDIDALVDKFFTTRHMGERGRSTEMGLADFTEDYVRQYVEDAILSGAFSYDYDNEILWSEYDSAISVSDLMYSLDARAQEQAKMLDEDEREALDAIWSSIREQRLNESRRRQVMRKNEASEAAQMASNVYYDLSGLFPQKSADSSWMKCAKLKELKSSAWWNSFKAAINDISSMPGVTIEYLSENNANTFAKFQKVVKSCANQYKDDYELQLSQDYGNDRIFISGGIVTKLSWDEIIISFGSASESRRIIRRKP